MEVFTKLPWNLQKNILNFHKPYYFDELFKYYIEKQLYNIISPTECFFNKTNNEIIIIRDEYYNIIFFLFKNFIKKIVVMDKFKTKLFLKNNIIISVNLNFVQYVLNRINDISEYLHSEITSSYSTFNDDNINIYGINLYEDVLVIFNEFYDLIIDYQIFGWKKNGEIICLFLDGPKNIKIFLSRKIFRNNNIDIN